MPKPAERARVICVACHDRKVKCDLQVSQNQTCSNCRSAEVQCVRRQGLRTKKKALRRLGEETCQTDASLLSPAQSSASTPLSTTAQHVSFISDNSELSYKSLPQAALFNSSLGVFGNSQAHHRPPSEAPIVLKEPLRRALIEFYRENCFHYFPIISPADLCTPPKSTLLHRALCLGGSLMRQTDDQSDFALSKTLYDECKSLLASNYEQDPLTLLKTISILPIWSPNSPTLVNLDGPWHWSGVAIRLAFQLGLHKEASYINKNDAGCRRRLWWQLYISDKLQTTCWGRPPAIRESDYDVRRLTLSDFENQDLEAQCVITSMELYTIVGKITEASSEVKTLSSADLTNLALLLQNWLANLPPELALYDITGMRKAYYRPTVEMHIIYFVAIILLESISSPSRASIHDRQHTPLPSFLASSCIVALYEEIYHRQQVQFLIHINAFFIMVAAISQLYLGQYGQQKEIWSDRRTITGNIELLNKVLQKMQIKYGGAGMVLQKIQFLRAELENSSLASTQTNTIRPNEQNSVLDAQEVASWFSVPEWMNLRHIFAFPSSLCDDMVLLDRACVVDEIGISGLNSTTRYEQWEDGELARQQSWGHEDVNFFTDIFGMDLGAFDMAYSRSLGVVDEQLISSNFGD